MRFFIAAIAALAICSACGGDDSPTSSPSPVVTATQSPTPSPSPATATPPPTATEPPTTRPAQTTPSGFPIDPATHLGVVTGAVGLRQLVFDGSGPTAYDYALNDQPSDDADRANRSGWNCATHYEYEGISAVDFYIAPGTPIVATMDGAATLYAVTNVNDFQRYGIDPEPYLGNPDRGRAPYSPFPGPTGGGGVFVHLENAGFVAEYDHLDLEQTAPVLPPSAFVADYSPSSDFAEPFPDTLPGPHVNIEIAQWEVHAGDVIGISGNSGYSEGPHIHYTVAHLGGSPRCPTNETGFSDGGWLFR